MKKNKILVAVLAGLFFVLLACTLNGMIFMNPAYQANFPFFTITWGSVGKLLLVAILAGFLAGFAALYTSAFIEYEADVRTKSIAAAPAAGGAAGSTPAIILPKFKMESTDSSIAITLFTAALVIAILIGVFVFGTMAVFVTGAIIGFVSLLTIILVFVTSKLTKPGAQGGMDAAASATAVATSTPKTSKDTSPGLIVLGFVILFLVIAGFLYWGVSSYHKTTVVTVPPYVQPYQPGQTTPPANGNSASVTNTTTNPTAGAGAGVTATNTVTVTGSTITIPALAPGANALIVKGEHQ